MDAGGVVVSVSTYPARFGILRDTLGSIVGQSVKPWKVCVVVDRESVGSISGYLRDRIDDGSVELLVGERDLGPHNKYMWAMAKYPDKCVVTFDDDMVYDRNALEELVRGHARFPGCIIARRGHRMAFSDDGELLPYAMWEKECRSTGSPESDVMATGVGGVLYPPGSISPEAAGLPDPKGSKADDIYLKAVEDRAGLRVVVVGPGKPNDKMSTDAAVQQNALFKVNNMMGNNDIEAAMFGLRAMKRGPGTEDHGVKSGHDFVYITDETAVVPMAVSMKSLRGMAGTLVPREHINVHVIASPLNIAAYRVGALLSTDTFHVTVHEVSKSYTDAFSRLKRTKDTNKCDRATSMSFFKFVIHSFVESRFVTYIDCDTVVTGDIFRMPDPGDGNVVSAVGDTGPLFSLAFSRRNPMRSSNWYFNSGVMRMDLDFMRNPGMLATLVDAYIRCGDYSLVDQNALNLVMKGRTNLVDPKYNLIVNGILNCKRNNGESFMQMTNARYGTSYDSLCGDGNSMISDAVVVHYAGTDKPWNPIRTDMPPEIGRPWLNVYESIRGDLSKMGIPFIERKAQ